MKIYNVGDMFIGDKQTRAIVTHVYDGSTERSYCVRWFLVSGKEYHFHYNQYTLDDWVQKGFKHHPMVK